MDEWTSPNDVWRIHRPDGWMIENLKSGFGESPIVYEDGKVAFDHPEVVPEYVKNKFRWMVKGRKDAVSNAENPDGLDELRNNPAFCEFAREQWKKNPEYWAKERGSADEIQRSAAVGVCVLGREPERKQPPKVRKPYITKAQRTRFGMLLGACIAIADTDLPFVGPDVKYLEVKMCPCATALHITVTVAEGVENRDVD